MSIFGIGTDIVEVPRIAMMIQKHGEQFVQRIYTPHEIGYCSANKASNQHFAGRWAAKEAILKALGTGWSKGVHWTDIEIRNEPGGRPKVRLGGAARILCEQQGIAEILITISHCRTFAVAYALAVRHTNDETT